MKRKLGIARVMDLSATPFFLRGSGYAEGTLFPWTMSDFSLMDAIESVSYTHLHGRYIDAMERVGATDLNGTTNNDRTNYFEDVPTSALDYTLWLESDRMGHLLGSFDQKTLDLQRGVVQNEKRQGENQPYGVTEQLTTENTYPAGHPYSWTVIGSMDDLNAASMSDVKEWFRTYYGPSNAVPVSYTHLDVYKRQGPGCSSARRARRWRRPGPSRRAVGRPTTRLLR